MSPDVAAILFLFVWQVFMMILFYVQQQDIARLSDALYRRQTFYAETNAGPQAERPGQRQPLIQSGYNPVDGSKSRNA